MASAPEQPAHDRPGRAEMVSGGAAAQVVRVAPSGRTVSPQRPTEPDAERRVRHEAAILQRLAGLPGVAQLAGELSANSVAAAPTTTGVTLSTMAMPLPVEEVIGVALGLGQAVAGMHARGVMHHNICPANIVLDGDGAPCLVGFGLATAVAEVRPEFTHPSQIVGELAYLAPEQTGRTGRAVDERADLYALGATLYELATGAPPFGSGDPLRLIRDHLTRVATEPAVANPAVPEPLSQIIVHLLAKEPDHRYQTAEGLVHDLQRLRALGPLSLRQLKAAGWRVGERDVPLRLAPPSRLIGRDEEVVTLQAAFEEALAGRCRGVLVAGAPGVGKTVLVDQLRAAVTGRDGWFVAGKFDQYRRDLDFDAGYQALRALARLLLAEPEGELATVRDRMLRALGPNAGLVTATLPEFAALLAVAPDPGDPLTAQVRAQWAWVQLLRAVASRKRPVVLFLDDLQWAGRTPVGFVDLVLRGDSVDGLLLVAAHREVDAAHPLAAPLARWRGQAGVRSLPLDNLPASAVVELVTEMLHLDPGTAAGLAESIAAHTEGNPYETVELLNAFRQSGVLTITADGWRWDAAAVRVHLDRAEPARLLADRVAALPAPSRELVQAMACLGGGAQLDRLATAVGTPSDLVEQHLTPALADGLLVTEPDAVRFRHDRIREAVLAGLDAQQRRGFHLAMARRLAEVPEWFAVAAEQYLPVADRVESAAERQRVVALLRRAAEQQALIGEYARVSTLLGAAVRLIDADQTGTLLAVRTARHAALFSAGQLDEADEEYHAIDALSLAATERASAPAVQVYSLIHRARYAEAMDLGLQTLRELGVAVPPASQLDDGLNRLFDHLQRWLQDTDDADELARPEITDPRLLAIAPLMNALMPVFYLPGNTAMFGWLALEAVRIWHDHGPAPTLIGPAASVVFAAVALRDDHVTGYRTARRMLAVGEARGYEQGTANARHALTSVACWVEPIEQGVPSGQRAREGLIAAGDLANASFTYFHSVYYLVDCAPSVDAIAAMVRDGLAFTARTGDQYTSEVLSRYGWLVRALCGEDVATGQAPLSDRYVDSAVVAFHAHFTRAVAAAIMGDEAALARHTADLMPLLAANGGQYPIAIARLLRGLTLAGQARAAGDDRLGLLAELNELTDWLATRAADAPANFSHLVRLLEAERAWAIGEVSTAELAFDTALREVDQQQRPWHQALIIERAARFYLSRGLNRLGHRLLAEARAHYAAWGATVKVAQLDWAYPTLQPTLTTANELGVNLPTERSGTPVTSGTIDLLGILSASQALSSETTIDRLQTRVVDILAAVTGATHVRLLLWSDDQKHWLTPTASGATPLATGHEHTVPMTVLRYLHRTNEPLVVADVAGDDRFARDPYFADHTHCALLAVPIHSRGTLRAALLLENRLLRGVFTTDRLDAVTLIAGQLAVSLDNANLYSELTASRARIVTTADQTRQRMERDLHDGAQQRLISLTMRLRTAQAALPPDRPDLATTLEYAAAEADAATTELRDLANGLHPAILSTSGLRAALRTLARRAPVPVTLQVHLDGRLPEAVETGAYYLIAEALTNAAKHAKASSITVTVDTTQDALRLTVADNGVGGADLAHGTGLLGLKDRAEALGGYLTLDSRPGAGTRLHAELPCRNP